MSDFFNTGLYKIFEPKYKDIIGKPFITVSAKGISNGLSNIANDGADFGPDTSLNATSPNQTGPPYTQTVGIQEALNYSASINNNVVDILILANGGYNTSTSIVINTNWLGVRIRGSLYSGIQRTGSGTSGTFITQNHNFGNSSLITLSSNSSIGNLEYIIIENINTYYNNYPILNLVAPEHVSPIIIKNCSLFGQNSNVSIATGTPTSGGSESVFIENSIVKGIENLYSFEGVPVIKNSTLLGSGTTNISGYTIVIDNTFFNKNISIGTGTSTGTKETFLLTKQMTIISGTTITNNMAISGGWIYWHSLGDILGAEIINQYPTYINVKGGRLTNISPLFSSTTIPTIFKYEGSLLYKVTIPSITSGISTPTVPSSGTTQSNTYLFPVNVYLYGGTVTEIQITKNGTAYVVLSNATGLALSGQVYKLSPSDSITITYTTAPTWEWLSD